MTLLETITEEVVGTLDMTEFENEFDKPPTCQFVHAHDHPCTVTVTNVIVWCTGSRYICKSAAQNRARVIVFGNSTCGRCGRPCSECWHIEPYTK